jgi:hypothetical protein
MIEIDYDIKKVVTKYHQAVLLTEQFICEIDVNHV